MYDICIIGADLLGAFSAHLLAGYSVKVLWLEQEPDVARGRSSLLSGQLSFIGDTATDNIAARAVQQGISMYPSVCRDASIPFRYASPPQGGHVNPSALCFTLAEEAVLNQVTLLLSQKVIELNMLQDATIFSIQTTTDCFLSRHIINTTRHCFSEEIQAHPNFTQLPPLNDTVFAAAPAIISDIAKTRFPLSSPRKECFIKRRPPLCLQDMLPSKRNDYVHNDPKAGRVLCRCMQLTEAEILDAIKRPVGAVDYEGIKRRIGAGSGYCDGIRCRKKIEELLLKEISCKQKN